ncbi:MAG: hypothetical protein ABID40_01815 [Candidatus Bipolaricaulota bacterium]
MRKISVLGVLVLGAVAGFAAPEITIYSGGFGFVMETRPVLLAQEGDLILENLPLTLLMDSLVVDGLTLARIELTWLGVPGLEDLVGTTVTVFAHGERFQGRLLASGNGLVLATSEGLTFLSTYDRIVAATLPEMASTDRLTAKVRYREATPGPAEIGLRYLAEGLSWHVSYAATLGEATLVLYGLATFENRTGIDFQGAQVSLVAGDVYRPTAKAAEGAAIRALAMTPDIGAVPAFEYHRYTLPGPVDLTQGIALVPLVRAELAYTRAYRFAGGPVEVRVRFKNTALPLPAGEVRFLDEGGRLFVGAASLGHTPLGKDVDLAIGAAFDLTGERVQEIRQRVTENLYRDTYRITLRSAKSDPVEIEVVETLPGTWSITQSSLPYERLDANRIRFRVTVPATGSAEVRYTVEWRY